MNLARTISKATGNVIKEATGSVKDLLRRSTSAVCAAFEREITVRAEEVSRTKQRLRSSGFMIIGTSEPIGRSRKIWFIRRGATL